MKIRNVLLAALVLCLATFASALPKRPANSYVYDENRLMSAQQVEFFDKLASELYRKTGVAIAAALVDDIGRQDARMFALETAESWGVGGKSNEGILIFVAMKQRRRSVEVGYGAEGYLPDALFADLFASGRALLYYTGVTRVARNILAQIVRNLFLGDRATLGLIRDIAFNADFAVDALSRADEAGLAEALRRSWALNCELDSGTCPPSVAPIAAVLERHGAAFKLLGAGGGGYLFAVAPSAAAAAEIRLELGRHPPNPRARFVTPSLSAGLQITRS